MLPDFGGQSRDGFLELQGPRVPWIRLAGDRRELPDPVAAQPAPPWSHRQSQRKVERLGPGSLPVLQCRPKALEIVGRLGLEQLGQSTVEPPANVVGKVAGRRRTDQVVSDACRSRRRQDDAAIHKLSQCADGPLAGPTVDPGKCLDARWPADDSEDAE